MGRIYLLAYGLGVPVNNARSTVDFAEACECGCQIATADRYADNKPDIVDSNKKGVFAFVQP